MTDIPRISSADIVVLAVLVCLVLPGPAVAQSPSQSDSGTAAAVSAQSTAMITGVNISGNGTFRHNGTRMVWQSSEMTVTVDIANADNGVGLYKTCAKVQGGGPGTCRTVSIDGDRGQVTLEVPAQSGAEPGRHRLVVNVSDAVSGVGEPLDTRRESITIVRKDGDLDLDRLSNERERELGLNMTNPDVDDDGLFDGDEVDRYRTDPRLADTDDDGALDGVEVSGPSNATDPDTDDDGLLDGTELDANLDPTDPDTDGDGLPDGVEFDGITDPALADTDGDGLDDKTEVDGPTFPTIADSDSDGVPDGREVALGLNATNADTDGDFLRDGLELTIGTNPASAAETVLKGIGVGILLGVIGALVVGRFRNVPELLEELREMGSGDRPTPADPAGPVPGDSPATAEDGHPDGEPGAAASDGMGAADAPSEPAADPQPDPELLQPDERIEHMLDGENGRIRQAEIVDRTDWSKAKVSRTLSSMEEEGTITRYRLGRENVVTLADEDIDDDDFDPSAEPD